MMHRVPQQAVGRSSRGGDDGTNPIARSSAVGGNAAASAASPADAYLYGGSAGGAGGTAYDNPAGSYYGGGGAVNPFQHRYTSVSSVIQYLAMVDADNQGNRMNAFGDEASQQWIEGHLRGISTAQLAMQRDTSVAVCIGALEEDAVHRMVGGVVASAQRGGGAGELAGGSSRQAAGNPTNVSGGSAGGASSSSGAGGGGGAPLQQSPESVMDLHDATFEDMAGHFDLLEHRLMHVNEHMNTIHRDVASVCGVLRAVDEAAARSGMN